MLLVASDYLFERTARRWPGACEAATVRPCARVLGDGSPRPLFGPAIGGGAGSLSSPFATWSFGGPSWDLSSECGCGCGLPAITLGAAPIASITSVKIDGVALPGTSYRIDDYRFLVRLDGEGWPTHQDLTLADTAVDTFSVTFTYGEAPPRGGVVAAAALGCELALACAQNAACRLPKRIQTLTRQQVTMAILDPLTLFSEGLTGVPEVDLFVKTYNPDGLRRPPVVLSPDRRRTIHRIGT